MFDQPLFGIALSLVAFAVGELIYRRWHTPLLNPIITSATAVALFLYIFHIPMESYQNGGRYITFILGPATVALAVPFYRQWQKIAEYRVFLIIGTALGAVVGIVSAALLAKLFGADRQMILSLIPKSVTAPIAMEVSRVIGGQPTLTIASVTVAGVLGAVCGVQFLKLTGLKDRVAIGCGIGTASHGMGTASLTEYGELEAAVAGVCIGLTGVFTAMLAPLIVRFLI